MDDVCGIWISVRKVFSSTIESLGKLIQAFLNMPLTTR